MDIVSLFDRPELFNDCINFIAPHFGGRETQTKAFSDAVACNDKLPQGYILLKTVKLSDSAV